MKTYFTEIIPRIQKFSQKLDDLTLLTNQHWVSIGEINTAKQVFIFRKNNILLISLNGVVDKGSWEYLGNQSILIETKNGSFLLKHSFIDQNIMALKLDSTDQYAFFVNETRYDKDLNCLDDVLTFLKKNYLENNPKKFKSQEKQVNEDISENQRNWMNDPNKCPACGYLSVEGKLECPDCGLNLR